MMSRCYTLRNFNDIWWPPRWDIRGQKAGRFFGTPDIFVKIWRLVHLSQSLDKTPMKHECSILSAIAELFRVGSKMMELLVFRSSPKTGKDLETRISVTLIRVKCWPIEFIMGMTSQHCCQSVPILPCITHEVWWSVQLLVCGTRSEFCVRNHAGHVDGRFQ